MSIQHNYFKVKPKLWFRPKHLNLMYWCWMVLKQV